MNIENGAEQAANDTASPDDEVEEAAGTPQDVEVEYEGKTYSVPAELKDALLRQADYTRKTQDVAQARKALGAFAPTEMTASQRVVDFLKSYEKGPDGGPALMPYRSPEKGTDTVGWGHKIQPGEDYSHGLTVTGADQLFLADLARHQKLVQDRVKVPLSQQQFDAMVSLAYNLPSAFDPKNSQLLGDLNQRDYAGAADQLPRWNHAGKIAMPGLTERRAYERDMFLNGIYTNHK